MGKYNWPKELRGPDVISEPYNKRRIKICMSCNKYNKYVRTCKECGCFMPAKTKLKGSSCPIGKWGKEDG